MKGGISKRNIMMMNSLFIKQTCRVNIKIDGKSHKKEAGRWEKGVYMVTLCTHRHSIKGSQHRPQSGHKPEANQYL